MRPVPVVFRLWLREHRHVAEVRLPARRGLGPVGQIQIGLAPTAPVQHHLPLAALRDHVLDDRLDRREAGAGGEEDDRLVGILAQVEAAERALDAQDLLPFIARTRAR